MYEEAIRTVMTVRDFTQVFDSYAQFEESMIAAKMETASELGREEEGEPLGAPAGGERAEWTLAVGAGHISGEAAPGGSAGGQQGRRLSGCRGCGGLGGARNGDTSQAWARAWQGRRARGTVGVGGGIHSTWGWGWGSGGHPS